jgi:hypothetical protein
MSQAMFVLKDGVRHHCIHRDRRRPGVQRDVAVNGEHLMDISQAREIDDDAMNTSHASDARIALLTLEKLRAVGHQPHTVTVGAVTIGLCVPAMALPVFTGEPPADEDAPSPPARKVKPEPGIYEEHGADLLAEMEDGKRDDE